MKISVDDVVVRSLDRDRIPGIVVAQKDTMWGSVDDRVFIVDFKRFVIDCRQSSLERIGTSVERRVNGMTAHVFIPEGTDPKELEQIDQRLGEAMESFRRHVEEQRRRDFRNVNLTVNDHPEWAVEQQNYGPFSRN